jgi:hypothetical protein
MNIRNKMPWVALSITDLSAAMSTAWWVRLNHTEAVDPVAAGAGWGLLLAVTSAGGKALAASRNRSHWSR